MSQTKMNYIYNSYDIIIDLIQSGAEYCTVIDKVRSFRDELPTTKQIVQEFVDFSEEIDDE